ncbi:MAG: hypothetical protein QF830_02890 [Rhodospirillales bacterium]|jgi:hypothetical protein|nr:hypothetical protein [Rhodospirillales bacterium]MDP6883059.1 hypothetical protein [Rhodospirillales bacterium]
MRANSNRVLALAIVLLAGCAVPRAVLEPVGGQIRILAPAPGFSPATLSRSWATEGRLDKPGRAVVVDKDGVPALRLTSGSDGFVLARLTRARLLATPYLSWAWNMGRHGGTSHPVGLVVGFNGAAPHGADGDGAMRGWLATALPRHDRRLDLVWHATALKRGSFEDRAGQTGHHYIQRGGRENTASWWLETADLADLYARAWPDDDQGRVGIVFIGIAAQPAATPAQAHVSGILLSR